MFIPSLSNRPILAGLYLPNGSDAVGSSRKADEIEQIGYPTDFHIGAENIRVYDKRQKIKEEQEFTYLKDSPSLSPLHQGAQAVVYAARVIEEAPLQESILGSSPVLPFVFTYPSAETVNIDFSSAVSSNAIFFFGASASI